MQDYEIKEGYITTVLGKHNTVQEALGWLNILFSQGWFERNFTEDSRVILVEGSFLTQRKEYPLKITGENKNRIATLL